MTTPQQCEEEETMEKFREVKTFDHIKVEAALCAWEWMLENRDSGPLYDLFDSHGTSAMRACSIQAGWIAERTYDLMKSKGIEFVGSYDWEFVPDILAGLDWLALVNDNQYARDPYEPDNEQLLTAAMTRDKALRPLEHRLFIVDTFDEWVDAAREESKRQWSYAEFVDDVEDQLKGAHLAGETPEAFIRRMGVKYDLSPAATWA